MGGRIVLHLHNQSCLFIDPLLLIGGDGRDVRSDADDFGFKESGIEQERFDTLKERCFICIDKQNERFGTTNTALECFGKSEIVIGETEQIILRSFFLHLLCVRDSLCKSGRTTQHRRIAS